METTFSLKWRIRSPRLFTLSEIFQQKKRLVYFGTLGVKHKSDWNRTSAAAELQRAFFICAFFKELKTLRRLNVSFSSVCCWTLKCALTWFSLRPRPSCLIASDPPVVVKPRPSEAGPGEVCVVPRGNALHVEGVVSWANVPPHLFFCCFYLKFYSADDLYIFADRSCFFWF